MHLETPPSAIYSPNGDGLGRFRSCSCSRFMHRDPQVLCRICLGPLTSLWGDTSQTFGDKAGQRAGLCSVAAGAVQSYLDLKIQARSQVWLPQAISTDQKKCMSGSPSHILLSARPSCDLSESRQKDLWLAWHKSTAFI